MFSYEFRICKEVEFKKIKKLIYIRNVDDTFNKEGPIEHTVEVNIFYKKLRKRTKINVIRE